MKNFISESFGQFLYFDLQLNKPDWKNKKILDFGGNTGNILADPDATITQSNYWCIDISEDAINLGKKRYPEAHFVYYNRYNFSFNPDGIPHLPLPQLNESFDIIISYSVFTANGPAEMLELVKQLEKYLAPEGIFAFTFIDPKFKPFNYDSRYQNIDNFTFRIQKLNHGQVDPELIRKNRDSKWSILINGRDLLIEHENIPMYPPKERKIFSSFFSPEYMTDLFPYSQVLPPPLKAYTFKEDSEYQHTCLIRKSEN